MKKILKLQGNKSYCYSSDRIEYKFSGLCKGWKNKVITVDY